jgi:hypothetical protein
LLEGSQISGLKNVHVEERSVRSPVMSDDLVQNVGQKMCEKGTSQFQNFHVKFHTFHTLFSARLA